MQPKVHNIATVKPASIIILVRPSSCAERTFGAKMIILKAPIAKPHAMTMVDWMLCFWMMPIKLNKGDFIKQPLSNSYKHNHVRELLVWMNQVVGILRFGNLKTENIQLHIIVDFISCKKVNKRFII